MLAIPGGVPQKSFLPAKAIFVCKVQWEPFAGDSSDERILPLHTVECCPECSNTRTVETETIENRANVRTLELSLLVRRAFTL